MCWKTALSCVVAGLCGLAGSGSQAAVVAGALVDLDAYNNSGAASDLWTNNGSLGGQLDWATFGGGSAPPRTDDGSVTYYVSNPPGSSWATAPATNIQGTPLVPFVDYTVELWIKRVGNNPYIFSNGGEHQILGLADDGNAGKRFYLMFHEQNGDNNGVDVLFRGTGNTMSKHVDAVSLTNGEWTQLVFTFDNTSKDFNIYKNGASAYSSNEPGIDMNDGKLMGVFNVFKLGGDENDYRALNGHISRVRIYDKALNLAEVGDNFAFGNTVVPEPTAAMLWAVGLTSLALRRRRVVNAKR